jgi:Type ISP C-terminal specificity domain/N-6 DNA Methylase
MTPLENYLRELREIRSTGAAVEEESYYHPLVTLFNDLGKKLRPRVKCVLQLANRGAGKPDGGLFTADQFEKPSDAEPSPGQLPARGAIEVKPTKDDAWITAEAKQVTKYWNKYRQVLVTNYRDFVLVGQDADGNAAILETYRLAESERAFWLAAASARATADKQNDRFVEYLQRVMRHAAPIGSPEGVAWFLASYARDALASIRDVELPALAAVREALEEALGLKFEGDKGEHFFRSSLIQTLFYGIFSAWVLWSRHNPPTSRKRFDWRLTAWSLRVPMISRLFSLVADPRQLDALKLSEVLDWTGAVLNRVDRASFFSKFEESHAVQYFYEPFLEAFDPELRKQLGVWYTPPEIVKYMVERVDTVLRQELGLPLGLADKNVYVLDPCCGTGSYLVEVLDRIHRTLKERGEDALTASDLKEAAQKRVFGFEILPAPFVVSHLQLGLLLKKLGVPLSEKGQDRVAVYLTNSLTGWEPPKGPKQHLIFEEMEEERDAAEHVKREVPILVILGNPPYNAFAGVSPAEEQGLVDPYKQGLKEWGITKNYIDDLYVRFFRVAERGIAERTGKGVVSFISNYSWVRDHTYVVLRQHLLASFDRLWIENMHGDRKISEYAPDGRTSETVFAIRGLSVGIRQGVAISLWVKSGRPRVGTQVLFRDDLDAARAAARRAQLLQSLDADDFSAQYVPAAPDKENWFSFRPADVSKEFGAWPALPELCEVRPMLGLNENRAGGLQSLDRGQLERRMKAYLDPDVGATALHKGLAHKAAGFDPGLVRTKVQKAEKYSDKRIVRYMSRPFDNCWAYISDVSPLWNRSRPELRKQFNEDARFLLTRPAGAASPEGVPLFLTSLLGEQDSLRGHAYYFPLQLWPVDSGKAAGEGQVHLIRQGGAPKANLSTKARTYIRRLGVEDSDANSETASLIWFHATAIVYSPSYLSENADGIRQDWPRIPLPDSKELLLASAALGRKIAALLDTETPFDVAASLPRHTQDGGVKPPLQKIAVPTRVDGEPLDEAKDLAVTAGWGHAGKDGVTMPGKGRLIERDYTPEELASFSGHSTLLGDGTCDVYLNEVAYWKNIPLRVWKYTIGGYQVIKKWLSYREQKLLGRPMTKDEVRWVQEMARRIAGILLLEPALDGNYHTAQAHAYPWPAALGTSTNPAEHKA